jgi:hypothetical protein
MAEERLTRPDDAGAVPAREAPSAPAAAPQPKTSAPARSPAAAPRQSAGKGLAAMAIGLVVLAVGVPLLRMFAEWLGRPLDEAAAWMIVQANERSATFPDGAVFGGLWDRIVSWAFGFAPGGALGILVTATLILPVRAAFDPEGKDFKAWPVGALAAAIVGLIMGLPLGVLGGAFLGAFIGGLFGTIWVAVFGGSGVPSFSFWAGFGVLTCALFQANLMLKSSLKPEEKDSFKFRGAWLLLPVGAIATLATMAYLFQGRAPNLVLAGNQGPVTGVAISPDGQFVASGGDDKIVRLWRASDGSFVNLFKEHGDRVNAVAFSPDGKLLASGGSDQKVRLWNIKDGRMDRALDGPARIDRVAFSPDGKVVAAGCNNGVVELWQLDDGRPPLTWQGDSRSDCTGLAFTSDGSTVAAAFSDRDEVRLWQTADARPKSTIPSKHGIASISCSPSGAMLAAGSEKGVVEFLFYRDISWYESRIQLLDPSSGKILPPVEAHHGDVTSLAFSSDGKFLASAGGEDRTARLWRVGGAVTQIAVLTGSGGDVTSVAASPDGTVVAAGGSDGVVRVWHGASPLLWK